MNNETTLSAAINFVVNTYYKTVRDLSNQISQIEVERNEYDGHYIAKKITEIESSCEELKTQAKLNELLFYYSMIREPADCRHIYEQIYDKSDFAEYGYPAICYYYKGEYSWALKRCQEYYSTAHIKEHPLLLMIYGDLLQRNKEFDLAKSILLKAVNIMPEHPQIHLLLYEIYKNENDTANAEKEKITYDLLTGERFA